MWITPQVSQPQDAPHRVSFLVAQTQSSSYIFFLSDVPVLSHCQARDLLSSLVCLMYPHPQDQILPQNGECSSIWLRLRLCFGDSPRPTANHRTVFHPSAAGLRHLWILGKWLIKWLLRSVSVGHSLDPDVWLGLAETLLVALLFTPGSRKELESQIMETVWCLEPLTSLLHLHPTWCSFRSWKVLLFPSAPYAWTKEIPAIEPEWLDFD